MKNYLKLGVFLFGISLMLVNCENDSIENRQEFNKKSKFTVKKITHKQVVSNKKIETKISKYKNLTQKVKIDKTQERLLHSDTYGFTIDTDNVNYLERTDGYHSYSFYLIRDNPVDDKLENLVLSLNENGEYDTFILKYEFSIAEYSLLDQNTLPTYTTQITPIDFDTSVFNTSEVAKMLLYVCAEVWVWDVIDGGSEGQLVGADNVEEATHGWIFDGYDCNWISGGGGEGEDSGNNDTDNTENTGSGTNNGSISSAPTSCRDCLEEDEDEDPCDKINRLNTNNPTLKQELLNLKNIVDTAPTERGKYKLNSTSIIQNAPVGVNDEVVLINPSGNQKYEMIAHTHNAPAENTYSVFSYEDLYALAQLLRKGKIDTNNFVTYLITADGTNYALTIDNPTQFLNTFAIATDREFDMNIAVNRVTQRTLYYSGNKDVEPLIKEDNTSNADDQKFFLDFVKNTNMGLSLFEISDDFETYKKLTHNPFTGDINKTDCN